MSTSDSCKEGSSKSNLSDGICEMNDRLQNMSTVDNDDIVVSVCANCGKEGSDVNNICNKCKQVKYCNAACKKKHRHKHKKDCEEHIRLAAEQAAKLHDKKLFEQQPPPSEDCPICFMRMPTLKSGRKYMSCCGKEICSGCMHAPLFDNQGNKVDGRKCPFCRTPVPNEEEMIKRMMKRMEASDAQAIYSLGCNYRDRLYDFSQDHTKALEFFRRSGELGYAESYTNIGYAYSQGKGVEVDKKKAMHYYELAAMRGDTVSRHNLGNNERRAGNIDRALKHHMIAVKDGDNDSLNEIKELYSNEQASKEDYKKALQSYQEYLGEIKSKQRDEAAAADDKYRYY